MALPLILCVDDEPIVLDSLKEQLRRRFSDHCRIEIAQDAAEALELIGELDGDAHSLAAVISDHIMPGMKGDALLVEIHRRLPRTRKILLTGQAGVEALANVVNLGALYRYLAKPWDRDDLVMTVSEAVRSFEHELEIERKHEELRAAHEAGLRFVPFEFLRLLTRARLAEVSLHDHVEARLNIFFSDIRDYTPLVEGKSPAETFAFINEYLAFAAPPIREAGGFIDSFAGDGIMALFEGSPDQAVRAGIASHRAVERFNAILAARGEPTIRIGVGITTGQLMLGILGSGERLNAGVVGDAVNVASRIEGYTKAMGAHLLVSGATVAGLDDPSAYALRLVDRVRLKGKTLPIEVYEVLDAAPEAERARKLATRADLDAARAALAEGRVDAAEARLAAAHAIDPGDPVIVRCLARCAAARDRGPQGEIGITDLGGA